MNRTERLFHLLKILRGYRYPVSGQRLAERLNVSLRTLYRDIATLQSQGAEIEGEVGVGYVMKPTFFLPPLMLTKTEMDSLLLGARWVMQYGDLPLSKAASDALNKIFDVLPKDTKNSLNSFSLRVGPPASESMTNEDLTILRAAIAHQKIIHFCYRPEEGKEEMKLVWPITIGYFTDKRILVAWCDKQKSYQHFNTQKMSALTVSNESYPRSKDVLFREWQAKQLRKK